jgi:uncharacterized protein (DUF2237 family)
MGAFAVPIMRMQAAKAAWQDAKQAGVQPDLILYSAMIDCCAKVRVCASHV